METESALSLANLRPKWFPADKKNTLYRSDVIFRGTG